MKQGARDLLTEEGQKGDKETLEGSLSVLGMQLQPKQDHEPRAGPGEGFVVNFWEL